MRSSKNRSRSKSNRQRSIGNIVNRVFDSSGPEGKVRGTPQQIIDKYLMLARDAQLGNDRVAEQNFLQHAEHYTRMLGEAQRELLREQEQRQGQPGGGQAGGQSGGQQYENRNQNGGYGGGNGNGGGQPRYDQPRYEQPRMDDAGDRGDEAGPQPSFYPEARAAQPLPVAGDEDGPGLVETPEAHVRPVVSRGEARGEGRRDDRREPRAAREPRGDTQGEAQAGDASSGDQPKGERRPRNQRRPRGPREGAEAPAEAAVAGGEAPGGSEAAE